MVRRLKKGDARVFKVLADRTYGKVKEQVEFDASAIVERLLAGRQRALDRLSKDEIEEQIRQLERKLGYAPAIDEGKTPQSSIAESDDPEAVLCDIHIRQSK